jgi:hypothetical protein
MKKKTKKQLEAEVAELKHLITDLVAVSGYVRDPWGKEPKHRDGQPVRFYQVDDNFENRLEHDRFPEPPSGADNSGEAAEMIEDLTLALRDQRAKLQYAISRNHTRLGRDADHLLRVKKGESLELTLTGSSPTYEVEDYIALRNQNDVLEEHLNRLGKVVEILAEELDSEGGQS